MSIKVPKQNLMPELEELHSKNSLNLILNLYLRRGGPNDKLAKGLWINYVRMVDQAIYEYHFARKYMEEFVTTDNNTISPLLRCSTHFENCIVSIRKAINFARSIRKNQAAPEIPKTELLSDRGARKIMDARNMLEHLEENLIKGKIEEGSMIMLAPEEKYLSIGSIVITYAELSVWLKELFEIAEVIKDYRPTENA